VVVGNVVFFLVRTFDSNYLFFDDFVVLSVVFCCFFEAELPFISVLTLIKKKLACSKSCLSSALTFGFPQQIILPLT
jgi:hypothetical protein